METRIILASGSKRRNHLLRQIGIPFVSVTPHESVEIPFYTMNGYIASPELYVEEMAYRKAASIAEQYIHGIIVGADTVIQCGEKVFGKPGTPWLAFQQLKYLSGKVHTVITGLVVLCPDKGYWLSETVKTKVWIKCLSSAEIISYVRTGEPLDKAGGYAIQEKGALFVEKIEGDYFNVVGLPLFCLCKMLESLGYSLLIV
jgi:septum formation protein